MKQAISFDSGGYLLRGRLHVAEGSGKGPAVLLLSGFPGSEEDVLSLGERLSSRGIHTLTFNYRGIYQSNGEYALGKTFEDIAAAFHYLAHGPEPRALGIDPDRTVLGGWSYGGGMALSYAAAHPEVSRVFSIAGTDHGQFARDYRNNPTFAATFNAIFDGLRFPEGPVRFEGGVVIRGDLLANPGPYDLVLAAPALAGRDLLLVGAWDDENVVLETHVLPLYRALKAAGADRVKITALPDKHAFEHSRETLAELLYDWIIGSP